MLVVRATGDDLIQSLPQILLVEKIWTIVSDIRRDLENTLIKAVKQLRKTKSDIKTKLYVPLRKYDKVKYVQSIVVISDPFYHANNVGRKVIDKSLRSAKNDYDIIHVSELEYLLGVIDQSDSLFDLLQYKATHYRDYDFKEFTSVIYPGKRSANKYLLDYYEKYFLKRGVHIAE